MNFDWFFRKSMKISATWIMLCVLGGAKPWKFPLPFKEAWEKQKQLLKEHWND
jgi:hypothetical protein